MTKKLKSNWHIVVLLLMAGALPALPGAYVLYLITQGPPLEFDPNGFVAAHYYGTPLPIICHTVAGIVFAVLMPFQFAPLIRRRWPKLHRLSGRFVMVTAFVMAISALWMIHYYPQRAGFPRYLGLFVTSIGMMLFFGLALQKILQRNIRRHHVWVCRAVAVTYGAVIPALIIIPFYLIYGEGKITEFANEWSRWIGMILNLILAEWILRRERLM